jgi:hypothetical protein
MRSVDGLKTCTECKETKPVSEFFRNKSNYDGFAYQCKPCLKKWSKKWHSENKEKHAAHVREWAKNNQEWVKDYAKKNRRRFYEANKEKVAAQSKKWREANKEKYAAWCKQYSSVYSPKYYKENTDKFHEYRQSRRARLANAEGNFTKEEWNTLCEQYGYKCLCCGRDDVPMTPDHIVPLVKGGSNSISNIQPLCRSCNCKKHTKIIDYRNSVYAQV